MTRGQYFFPHWVLPQQAPAKTAHATFLGARGALERAVVSPMSRCSVWVNKTPPAEPCLVCR